MELMAIRERKPVHRFTAGVTSGVRRLLEIVVLKDYLPFSKTYSNLPLTV
jgi:hypothetical protein